VFAEVVTLSSLFVGMQHSRGVQGAAATDGGATEGYATGGEHLQKNRQHDSEWTNQFMRTLLCFAPSLLGCIFIRKSLQICSEKKKKDTQSDCLSG
jgi:hypothetical protein